jgi:hypothetical protein
MGWGVGGALWSVEYGHACSRGHWSAGKIGKSIFYLSLDYTKLIFPPLIIKSDITPHFFSRSDVTSWLFT